MSSFISITNKSSEVLEVTIDDEIIFSEVLPNSTTKPKMVRYASTRVIIKNSREKPIFDLWLPIKKETSHTLILWDTSYDFK